MPSEASNPYVKAQRHLGRRDPVLKRLIAAVGPCTLTPNPDGFRVLVRAIVSQMISTKAAESISARLETVLGGSRVTPARILAATDESMRGAGLSASKVRALRDLAERARNGALPFDRLPEMEDDEVVERLVAVRGIGAWTAQMFLIFSLGRLDVLPVADLGLRAGVQDQFGLDALPDRAKLHELAAPWQPFRSVATWYLWRSRGQVPQSK
jgi:DNA-3-methyladenine glycosylase II